MNESIALNNMLKQQLRTGDVLDEAILDLYDALPREDFTPEEYRSVAYSDMQIPLSHQQTMMTPLEEGKCLQSLKLTGQESVLEVGTGSAYLTALLAKLSKRVVSVDIYPEFTEQAASKLKQYDINNVELITGDAHQGWMNLAPYDVIVLTGSIKEITKSFRLQLMKGGKLFAVIGQICAMQGMLFRLDDQDNWHKEILFDTKIAPLIDNTLQKAFVF